MNFANHIVAEPPAPRAVQDLSRVVEPNSTRYQLTGRLSNSGTHICDIRVPGLFDSEHAIRQGKLYYGKGTERWSDIYWRTATDVHETFRYIVFAEIRQDLEFRLYDLVAHANTPGQEETFFKGPAFILNPPTIPHTHLAETVARRHARKTTPENKGSYEFRGCLEIK